MRSKKTKQIKRNYLIFTIQKFQTYKDINIPEANRAVGDERCVEGVEVGDVLHVGDEGGYADKEDHQDGADDHGVEPLVRVVLLLQSHVQVQEPHPERVAVKMDM